VLDDFSRYIVAWKLCTTMGADDVTATLEMNVETKFVGSDLCKIQGEKLTWSTKDTVETIHGVRRFNAKWDRRCGGDKSS